MNTSSSASKKVFPITSQVYENVGNKAAKANDSKPFFGGKKLSTGTRLKLRTLEMAENWVMEILQGEPKNSSGQQQQQPPLKIVEKLELMEDFIDQLPPYHWMQAKEWTKRLLTLWRLFGRSAYVQAQGGPLAAAAKEGGRDNSRGGVAQKKNGPKTEASSSSSYADRRAAALHSSPVAKLRKLHFLEETIIKILRCNNNNSILLSSVEEYLRKSEEVVRQLPLTLRPEEWTKRVAQLRAEYHAKDVAEKEKRGELSPLEQQLTSIRVFLEGVFPDELLVFDLLPDITTVGRIKQWVAELLTGGGEDDETEETEKEEEDIVAPKTPKTTTTTTKKHLLGYEGKVLDEKATVAACGIKDQAVLDFLEFEEEEEEEEEKEKDNIEGKKEEDNKKENEKEELLLLGSDGFQFGVNVQPMKKLSWSETGSTFKMAKS